MPVLFLSGAAVLLGVDLLTKALFDGSAFTLVSGFISIFPTRNTGAAFSMFSGGGIWLVLFTSLIIIAGIFIYFRYHRNNRNLFFNIACAFVLGGALGNLYDRIFLGGVRDFIRLDFVEFPIFNFADICLNIGVLLLAVWILFVYRGKSEINVRGNGTDGAVKADSGLSGDKTDAD